MDTGFKLAKVNPKKSANILSKLFFVWIINLFVKGVKHGITMKDLYVSMASDSSKTLGNKLERNWIRELENAQKQNRKPSLYRALSQTFFILYIFYGFLMFFHLCVLRAFQPVLIALFVQEFTDLDNSDENRTYYQCLYGGLLAVITAVALFIYHHSNLQLSRAGMRARVACSSLIYRKTLRLSKKSLGANSTGQIINLLSNDFVRFDLASPMLNVFWIIPIQIVLVTYFIWLQVGWSAFAGVSAMVVMTIPVQGVMGKLTAILRKKVALRTDYRVKLMGELISGIQVIKMYVWEKPFDRIVQAARRQEIKVLTYTFYLKGVYASFSVFTERTALYFSILCYYLLGNTITADKAFSMAQFFNILQVSMAIFFPLAITLGAESLVAIRRAEEILMMEEKKNMVEYSQENRKGIQLEKVQASWSKNAETLKNLNVTIPEGMLCAIVGPVGAGKSSVLQLLLGEFPYDFGKVSVTGRVSYASQEPWLFVSSVRQNIIYTEEYNRKRYKRTVEVCALKRDLELFPDGDRTLVGERGVSLSGGQRARINLARAIYQDADIYLLDDPLSAVDTHVANHLFDECIFKHLRGKTRILVTHQLQFLKKVDHIVILNGGAVEAQGSFRELMDDKSPYLKLLVSKQEEMEKQKEKEQEQEKMEEEFFIRSGSTRSVKSTNSSLLPEMNFEKENEEAILSQGATAYVEYFKAGANMLMRFLLPFSLIFGQVITSGCDFWLNLWTRSDYAAPGTDFLYLHIYTVLIVACVVFVIFRSILYYKTSMNASQTLHDKMFSRLLSAPMRFFDTNPSGRVLNRFSRDMGAMDEILPRVALEALQIFLIMCGILVNIAIANYYMVIAAVILGSLFVMIRSWYVATAKDIKHIEGIAKSPMLSHINATLNGIVTIRSTRSEEILQNDFDKHQDVHTSAWYLILSCMAAVGLWLDILCILFLLCITFGFILMDEYGEVNSSNVGLAVSQAMILTGMLQYGVRQSTEVVNQMTSVERILEYTQIESEETLEVGSSNLPKSWPDAGRIHFDRLCLRYAEREDPVLRDLQFTIEAGQKIGIVGRTGAGKSSIISALFRLAPIDGSIVIDGVDTKAMPLSELRQHISIIPQEPVLFSSTVRYNLDPFGNYPDSDIYSVLEEVELKESIPSLDYEIAGGGANFSVGQRQLICLARAILRNNRILVLDEATANVDHRTDALIQTTIRRKFSSCTVLTIAHRLNTIMDSDKILVMAAGRMVEYDHPHVLLQNVDGFLYKMVLETGPQMTAQLLSTAREMYTRISHK